MWFKQVTCDKCFQPMESAGRHNKYFFSKILEFRKLTPMEYQMNYNYYNNPSQFRFNYDTSRFNPRGLVYCYRLELINPQSYATFFCSKKCALEVARRDNVALFYFDESDNCMAFLLPQTVEINRVIDEPDYSPLLFQSVKGDQWFVPASATVDLRPFGFNNTFQTFAAPSFKLVKPNAALFEGYKKLVTQSDFERDYWGASNTALRNQTLKMFPNLLESNQINFGRRMFIEWYLVNNSGEFIGFIHLTCMYQAYPYRWVVEFGMVREYRGRGIMKGTLKAILKWAKENGCDEVLAVSEDFNHACHAVIKSVPYPVNEIRTMMSDQYAGNRPMRNFKISLI